MVPNYILMKITVDADDQMSSDEVGKKAKQFLNEFHIQYSETGPLSVSFPGSLGEALKYSLFDSTLVTY